MLQLQQIDKSFPGVRALRSVTMDADDGSIHALLGENGAGKSTLIKAVCGVHALDAGTMLIDGERYSPDSVHDALKSGIALVSQEIQVVPGSTVAENIMLDKLHRFRRWWGIHWKILLAEAETHARRVGLDIDLTIPVRDLSAAHKQLIQIAKALSRDARILFLDEPTSSITEHEATTLFRLLRELRDSGVLIVIVSHKLEEIFEIADRIHVLRDGEMVATLNTSETDETEVIEAMIGRGCRDVDLGVLPIANGTPALEVRGIHRRGMAHDVSLDVHRGEILGLYGLVGAGRTELARLIIGAEHAERGEVYVEGKLAAITSVRAAQKKYKIGYVTENRKEEGLFLDFSVRHNATVSSWEAMRNGPLRQIDPRAEREATDDIVKRLQIKTSGQDQIVSSLSGGNQQKICIGRWLLAEMDILIIDEPTVGIDIGAKEYIHDLIWDLAERQNKAIILISSDMPEIVKLARRILVFKEHRIVGELTDLNAEGMCEYAKVSRRLGAYLK